MAPTKRTGCVRAFRDTPVVEYSVPGISSTRYGPYNPLIAVALYLHVLSGTFVNEHFGVTANCDIR
jgi:hypothetical protein